MFQLSEYLFEMEKGQTLERTVLEHPGAVIIVPRTENGDLILLRQYRFALQQEILEFPAGTLEIGEEPLACAKRELIEETGFQANSWDSLGTLFPSPGFCDEVQYCYVASDLEPAFLEKDEDEIIEPVHFSPQEVLEQIDNGSIADCKTVALMMRLQLYDNR